MVGENKNVDVNNKVNLEKIFANHEELILIAEYDVTVVLTDSNARKQEKEETHHLRRYINILEVAANYARQFSQVPLLK